MMYLPFGLYFLIFLCLSCHNKTDIVSIAENKEYESNNANAEAPESDMDVVKNN